MTIYTYNPWTEIAKKNGETHKVFLKRERCI